MGPKAKPTLETLETAVRDGDGAAFLEAARALAQRSPARAAQAAGARLSRTGAPPEDFHERSVFFAAYFCAPAHVDALFDQGLFGLSHFPWAALPPRIVEETLTRHRAQVATLDDDAVRRMLRLWELWPAWFFGEPLVGLVGVSRAGEGRITEEATRRRVLDTQPYAPGPTVGHSHGARQAIRPEDNPTLHALLQEVALEGDRAADLRMAALIELGGFGQHLRLLPLLDDALLTPELALQVALEAIAREPERAESVQLAQRVERFQKRCRDADAEDVTAIVECGRLLQHHLLLPSALAESALLVIVDDVRVDPSVRQEAEHALAAAGGAALLSTRAATLADPSVLLTQGKTGANAVLLAVGSLPAKDVARACAALPQQAFSAVAAKLVQDAELRAALAATPGATIDPRFTALALGLLSSDPSSATRIAVHAGGAEAMAALMRAVDQAGPEDPLIKHVAFALGESADAAASPFLLRLLEPRCVAAHPTALLALSKCGGADALPVLAELAAARGADRVLIEAAVQSIEARLGLTNERDTF